MSSAEITLTINGVEMDASVRYEFEGGQEAITDLAPEDCQPGYPDEWHLISLTGEHRIDNSKARTFVSLGGLLKVEGIRESIIVSIKESLL